jgi:hypothetical protein
MGRRIWLRAVLFALVPVLHAQAEVVLPPAGVLISAIPEGLSGMSFPLVPEELVTGTLVSASGAQAVFPAALGAIGPRLQSEGAYYLEILGGAAAGERYDLDTAATMAAGNTTVVVAFGAATHSTGDSLDPAVAGTLAAVRRHMTLAQLSSLFSPALTGSDDPAQADGLYLYESGSFVRYSLRADGATWVRGSDPTDERHVVIPPDESVMLDLKSGPRQLVCLGQVRTTVFRKNLRPGDQSWASGFPVDLTPAQAGGFADLATPVERRWVGSGVAAQADAFTWFAPESYSFVMCFLRGDGASWRRPGRPEDQSGARLLRSDTAVLLRRAQADPAYRISPPFSP